VAFEAEEVTEGLLVLLLLDRRRLCRLQSASSNRPSFRNTVDRDILPLLRGLDDAVDLELVALDDIDGVLWSEVGDDLVELGLVESTVNVVEGEEVLRGEVQEVRRKPFGPRKIIFVGVTLPGIE